jgi:hypothetical protein
VLLPNIGAEVHDRRTARGWRLAAICVFRSVGAAWRAAFVVAGDGEWITVG